MEKNVIGLHNPVVSTPNQCFWFSECNFCGDSKKNNTGSPLESFYIPREMNWAQLVDFVYKGSGERKFFLTAGEIASSLKLEGRVSP